MLSIYSNQRESRLPPCRNYSCLIQSILSSLWSSVYYCVFSPNPCNIHIDTLHSLSLAAPPLVCGTVTLIQTAPPPAPPPPPPAQQISPAPSLAPTHLKRLLNNWLKHSGSIKSHHSSGGLSAKIPLRQEAVERDWDFLRLELSRRKKSAMCPNCRLIAMLHWQPQSNVILNCLWGKIQGNGRKFLDRFKSYFGSQISLQSLNEVHIYRLQPKSATQGEFYHIVFLSLIIESASRRNWCKWRTKPTKCC